LYFSLFETIESNKSLLASKNLSNEKCCASKEEENPKSKPANKKIRFVVMLKTIKNKGLQQGMPI
jgi:hypothetical protein